MLVPLCLPFRLCLNWLTWFRSVKSLAKNLKVVPYKDYYKQWLAQESLGIPKRSWTLIRRGPDLLTNPYMLCFGTGSRGVFTKTEHLRCFCWMFAGVSCCSQVTLQVTLQLPPSAPSFSRVFGTSRCAQEPDHDQRSRRGGPLSRAKTPPAFQLCCFASQVIRSRST